MARVYCGTYCTQCWHFLLSCEAFDKSPKMHMANQLTVPEREEYRERERDPPLRGACTRDVDEDFRWARSGSRTDSGNKRV